MSPLIELALRVGGAVASQLVEAILTGQSAEVQRLAAVLPQPLRSEIALRHQEELARQRFERKAVEVSDK